MIKRLFFYVMVALYVLYAVGLNSLSVYLKVSQAIWDVQSAWYVLPPLVVLFMAFSLWLRTLYRKSNPETAQKILVFLVGVLVLVIPVIPAIALHLDLPFSVPFLQFAGANLLFLPWFHKA
jgi:hypothetical protein